MCARVGACRDTGALFDRSWVVPADWNRAPKTLASGSIGACHPTPATVVHVWKGPQTHPVAPAPDLRSNPSQQALGSPSARCGSVPQHADACGSGTAGGGAPRPACRRLLPPGFATVEARGTPGTAAGCENTRRESSSRPAPGASSSLGCSSSSSARPRRRWQGGDRGAQTRLARAAAATERPSSQQEAPGAEHRCAAGCWRARLDRCLAPPLPLVLQHVPAQAPIPASERPPAPRAVEVSLSIAMVRRPPHRPDHPPAHLLQPKCFPPSPLCAPLGGRQGCLHPRGPLPAAAARRHAASACAGPTATVSLPARRPATLPAFDPLPLRSPTCSSCTTHTCRCVSARSCQACMPPGRHHERVPRPHTPAAALHPQLLCCCGDPCPCLTLPMRTPHLLTSAPSWDFYSPYLCSLLRSHCPPPCSHQT